MGVVKKGFGTGGGLVGGTPKRAQKLQPVVATIVGCLVVAPHYHYHDVVRPGQPLQQHAPLLGDIR